MQGGRRRRALRVGLLGGAAALAAVAALAAGAGPSTQPQPSTTTTAPSLPSTPTTEPPTTTTTITLPQPDPIAWNGCGGGFECAVLTVPVDYTDPDGATLDLSLIRRPAADPVARIGTLVMNPGGPGASGVRRVRRGFQVSAEVARRFDIVGFDPRGVGESGRLDCGDPVDAFRLHDLSPDDEAEAAALESAARAVADECAAAAGDLLGRYGTVDVARDLEMIRRALGEDRISFVGLSYGTLVGLLWADEFPGSVRGLVLDGVVDPASTAEVGSSDQVRGVERTFMAIDTACAADPSCPLAEQGGVVAAYDELAARLEQAPVGGIGPTQLAYAAIYATYGDQHWPRLWRALRRGLDGDLRGIAELTGAFTSLVDYVPFAIVSCLDAQHPQGMAAWTAVADRQAAESSRFGRVITNELLPCAFWPPATFEPHAVEARGTPPILVVGSTGDAVTPYSQAERVAAALADGHLLTVEVEGHVAIGDSRCAEDAITRYLIDGTVPAPDATC